MPFLSILSVIAAFFTDLIKGDHLLYLVIRLIVVLVIWGLVVWKINWNKRRLEEIEGD